MKTRVNLDSQRIEEFCRRNGISKLSVFGSALRDDFLPDSDVDILVEFQPNVRVGLIRLAGMQEELSVIIGRVVDLRTPNELSPYFRDKVMESAEVQYAA